MARRVTPVSPIEGVALPVWLAPVVLVLAAVIAYHNTFSAPFVFDDLPAIAQNQTLRDLRRPSELLAPPALRGSGVAGRPVVNLSLALNQALGGDEVWGYHAFNLLVHAGAGLALFGVVRRVGGLRRQEGMADEPRREARRGRGSDLSGREVGADTFAFMVALLWLLHPLQTESVTCIIQRTESLAGFFYLFTFYSFVRSVKASPPRAWTMICAAACLLGAATKEIMATAPCLLLLFDRTFVAGTFRESWRLRGRFYLTLAVTTWLVIGALVWRSEVRGGTVGFGHGVTAWDYLLTQCRAIVLYLKLACWPHPLVLDYGAEVVRDPLAVLPQGLFLLATLASTIWALVRRPILGFLGGWFFVVLAPSSSFVPLVTQTMAEHRMYLPLAAVVVLAVAGLRCCLPRAWPVFGVAVAVALGGATIARNADYRSAESIWRDTVAKWPTNPRGHYTLAQLADEAGRHDEAITHGKAAVDLLPRDPTAHFNLAFSLAAGGRPEEALVHYAEAARLRPESADPHINAGSVLARLGRVDEAIAEYEIVVRLKPDSAEDQFNLAEVYRLANRTTEAIARYEAAAKAKPELPNVYFRLGNALLTARRFEPAVVAYREALRRAPTGFESRVNLAGALVMLGRPAEAVPVYEEALRLRADPQVSASLAAARARL
ncbi:MAG: tetratricopeptide repeat protein [Opitutaceae bacterium]